MKFRLFRRTYVYVILALLSLIFGSLPLNTRIAQAAIPKYINFQGKLTQVSGGTNVANGTYAFEFKIYDAVSSGSLLYTETYDQPSGACTKLTVTNGVFNAKIGSCNAISFDFTGGSLYLSVNFAPTGTSYDGEMSPRKQLVAAPYAFVANSLNGDGTIDLADFDTDSDGKTVIAPDTAGDALTLNAFAGDFQGLVIDAASADSTATGGIIDLNVDSATDAASAMDILFRSTGSTSSATNRGLLVAYDPEHSSNARTLRVVDIDVAGDSGSLADTITGLYVDVTTGTNTSDTTYAAVFQGGNVGIGTVTPQALFEIAGADTVDGSLAISADRSDDSGDTWFIKSLASGNALSVLNEATEVLNLTTAGALQIDNNITVSGLAGNGTKCIHTDNNGLLSVTASDCGAGGGSQTPWTADVDADGFDLNDVSNILFRETTGAPAGTDVGFFRDNTGDLNLNVLTGKTFNVQVNASDEYNFSSTALALGANNITGSTSTIDFDDFDVDADGKIVLGPDSTGDAFTINGFAGDFQGIVIDAASAASTNISGIIDLNFDSVTNNGSAMDIALTTSGTTSSATNFGMKIGYDPGHATNARTAKLLDIDISGDSGSLADTIYGINIDASTTTNTSDITTAINLVNNISTFGTTAVAGMLGTYTFTNTTTDSQYQFGNRFINTIASASGIDSTYVGEFIRMIDNDCSATDCVNTVRGMEIQAYSGTNNAGTNTGLAAFAKTFGVHASTSAQAGAVSQPAAVFADLDNGTDATTKTLGNAIRAYTNDATSANMVSIYQETSAYTGTGLVMNFANNSGTFASGNFIDLQKAGSSYFKVASTGVTSVNLNASPTAFGICHSGADVDAATDTMRDLVSCDNTPGDIAEWYETEEGVEAGDVVVTTSGIFKYSEILRDSFTGELADKAVQQNIAVLGKSNPSDSTGMHSGSIVGVVSTSPYQIFGQAVKDAAKHPQPIAVAGRVPVKVTIENGSIKPGDYLTMSNDQQGHAAKSVRAGTVIGQALEFFDGLDAEKTTVMMFVNVHFWMPSMNYLLQDSVTALVDEQTITNLNMADALVLDKLVVSDTLFVQKQLVVAERIVTAELEADMVRAKNKLCVGNTCVTEAQLESVLELLGGTSASSVSNINMPVHAPENNGVQKNNTKNDEAVSTEIMSGKSQVNFEAEANAGHVPSTNKSSGGEHAQTSTNSEITSEQEPLSKESKLEPTQIEMSTPASSSLPASEPASPLATESLLSGETISVAQPGN